MGDDEFAIDDIQPQSTGALVNLTTGIFDHGCEHAASHSAGLSDDQSTQQPSPEGIDEKQELSLANVSSLSPNSGCTTEKVPPLPEEPSLNLPPQGQLQKLTLESLSIDLYRWLQETFPTVTAVVSHMPFALVPFAFAMFVLVQALATKGWIEVFAYGWDHWVNRTGTIGAIGGMGFLSVILCNVSMQPGYDSLRTKLYSLPERTSARQFSSLAWCRPGRRSTAPMGLQLAIAHSGQLYTAWRLESTTGHSARRSAHPWRDSYGGIFSCESIFACAAWISQW
jgi:hypothetical protein